MEIASIVRYPTQREEWLKTVLIGGVLIFFGFLLVPLFLVYGYLVRTIRRSLSQDSTPPAFGNWGELLVDGLQAWVISLVYLLVPVIVAAFTIGGSIVATATGSRAGAAAGIGGLFFGITLTAILSVLFGYLAVVAIVNFAREDRFGAGFDVEIIRAVALNRDYTVAFLVSVGVVLVASLVGVIPLVGWILTPFVSFYAMVVAANLWAGGFAQALKATDRVVRSEDDEIAA